MPSAADPRSGAQHDRDRIYYSFAFRRLAGVTQVSTPTNDGFLTHNRLTHSFKVAQVARAIASVLLERETDDLAAIEMLGGLDVDVVEAAGLAHDLGHPPFGHIGETVLDQYARSELGLHEGFEGNAQTFRIVTRLEPRGRHDDGLDLTAATRAAILKYPWHRGEQPDEDANERVAKLHWEKFGAYGEEHDAFQDALDCLPVDDNVQGVEAAIMDVADDITYALHDLMDFYHARLLDIASARDAMKLWRMAFADTEPESKVPGPENPFQVLRRKLARDYPARFSNDSYRDALNAVDTHLIMLQQESIGTRQALSQANKLVSQIITDFTGHLRIDSHPTPDLSPIQLDPAHWHVVQILKELTRRYVIQRADFALIQRGQQALLRDLLDRVREWCAEDPDRLPALLMEGYRAYGNRAIVDFVAGLSDHQATALHRALSGQGPQSLATNFMA